MSITREELVKIARNVVTVTSDQHDYFGSPVKFDPHEWVLEAMQRSYELGHTRARESLFRSGAKLEHVDDEDGPAAELAREMRDGTARFVGPDDELPPDPGDSDAPRSPS